jgi:hypothetical protein
MPAIVAVKLGQHFDMGKMVVTLLQDRKIYMTYEASDLGTPQGGELLVDNLGLLFVNWYVLLIISIIVVL